MCTVSMIMDHYGEGWRQRYMPLSPPWPQPLPMIPAPVVSPIALPTKEELEEFRRLLDRARTYDKDNGEPDCELDEKRQMLKKLAEVLGVDISFIDR